MGGAGWRSTRNESVDRNGRMKLRYRAVVAHLDLSSDGERGMVRHPGASLKGGAG